VAATGELGLTHWEAACQRQRIVTVDDTKAAGKSSPSHAGGGASVVAAPGPLPGTLDSVDVAMAVGRGLKSWGAERRPPCPSVPNCPLPNALSAWTQLTPAPPVRTTGPRPSG
jgi:hypothetical protein